MASGTDGPMACEFCGKPETAEHWRRISAGWERVAWSVAATALVVGCGVGFVIGWAAFT